MRLGEKVSSKWIMLGENLPLTQQLCKSSLKGKTVPNFDDGAKCLDNISK